VAPAAAKSKSISLGKTYDEAGVEAVTEFLIDDSLGLVRDRELTSMYGVSYRFAASAGRTYRITVYSDANRHSGYGGIALTDGAGHLLSFGEDSSYNGFYSPFATITYTASIRKEK
jgi:hypothetical protein